MAKYYGHGITRTDSDTGATVTWFALLTVTTTTTTDNVKAVIELKLVGDTDFHIYAGDCSAALAIDGNVVARANPPDEKWMKPYEANAWTLISRTVTWTRGLSDVTHNITYSTADMSSTTGTYVMISAGAWDGKSNFGNSIPITVPAKASYTVSYNANGGSGAPASQTKQYNVTLKLQTATPTRTGYTFAGWNTNSAGTGTSYSAGGNYTANANATLYAKWTANTYKVAYNSNGGSGSMSQSTFTYNANGTLRTNTFTRTNYKFTGWATSANGGVAYANGATVKNLSSTNNATVNLYAVWKSRLTAANIRQTVAYRYPSDSDTGGKVTCSVYPVQYENDDGTKTSQATTVKCYYKLTTANTWTESSDVKTIAQGTTTATDLEWTFASGTFNVSNQYDIKVTASNSDSSSTSNSTTFISSEAVIIDIDPNGDSIGIFTHADTANTVILGLGHDMDLQLDDTAASGVDHDLISALTTLGITMT